MRLAALRIVMRRCALACFHREKESSSRRPRLGALKRISAYTANAIVGAGRSTLSGVKRPACTRLDRKALVGVLTAFMDLSRDPEHSRQEVDRLRAVATVIAKGKPRRGLGSPRRSHVEMARDRRSGIRRAPPRCMDKPAPSDRRTRGKILVGVHRRSGAQAGDRGFAGGDDRHTQFRRTKGPQPKRSSESSGTAQARARRGSHATRPPGGEVGRR